MKNEKIHSKGNNRVSQKRRTGKPIQRYRRSNSTEQAIQRCSSGTAGEMSGSPCHDAAHDFLNVTFLPKYDFGESRIQIDSDADKKLDDSLKWLAAYYSINIPEMQVDSLDYKWRLRLHYIKQVLQTRFPRFRYYHTGIETLENQYRIRVTEEISTEEQLFYVPVLPLYRLLKNRRTRKGALLLQGVFSFLYLCAEIPYYTDDYTFLNGEIDGLFEWYAELEDEGYREYMYRKLDEAMTIGFLMNQKIGNRQNIELLAGRLNAFRPKNGFDKNCALLAQRAMDILTHFKQRSFFAQAALVSEEMEYETRLMEHSFAFIPTLKGDLFYDMRQFVDNQLQECYLEQTPTVSRAFEGEQDPCHGLNYEYAVMGLMENLIQLLKN